MENTAKHPVNMTDPHNKALHINLDGMRYGTFAEIGAGQEVASWFFRVGAASGTVAKTMSAYDMTVSDAIYGKTGRYVSRERVERMLDHEYGLLHERLAPSRGDRTRFFAVADTAAAKSFAGGNECHAWMAIRFQHAFGAATSDVVLHARLLDAGNAQQADALGRLGVNLVHAAFAHWKAPKSLIETLLQHVGRERLEIDWIRVAGPAFKEVDNRLLGLHLVRIGYTPAVLFDVDGTPLLASESIRHARVLVERGRFAPVTSLNVEMLARARAAFAAAAKPNAGPVREILEITMNNLRDRGTAEDADFLARVDLINTVGKMVLVSDLGAFHALGEYLADRAVEATGLVLGVPLLREVFNESHYRQLDGGILEAFGRLFTHGVRLYVHPTRDVITGQVVTADTMKVAPHLTHLLEHLRTNGLILPLDCDPADLRTYSSEDVRTRICAGDPSWRELVPPPVADAIDRHGYFGASCPT